MRDWYRSARITHSDRAKGRSGLVLYGF